MNNYYINVAANNWALLSTREPTHKEVIFCKMNLKLDELC